MVKIVRIIARLNIGGPARNAVLLAEGFNGDGFKTCLVAGSPEIAEGDMSYFALEKGIKPVIINELTRSISPLKDIKALWEIYRIIKKEQPDIVHTHTAKAGTLGRIAAILYNIPLTLTLSPKGRGCKKVLSVHTFHGHVFDGYFGSMATKVFIAIERLLARFTTKVVAVSNSVANDVSMRYNITPKEKIEVIPLGFDLGRFLKAGENRGKLKKELGLPSDVLLVGIVGRLVPIKNHKMFLDVAKKLTAQSSQLKAKFIIVGDGELRDDLENYAAELGIKDKVIFLGWRRDLENIYADLDVVCLTSLNEGTPVSLIEAMASARPVVATDVGGVRDIVKNGGNGLLVSSGDVLGFSKALFKMLEDREKRLEMGRRGREFVAENFTKERLIEDMKSLYEGLLIKKGKIRGNKG